MNPDYPTLPLEQRVTDCAWFIAETEDGGKLLKLVPLAGTMTPQGAMKVPIGTAIELVFNEKGWENFQRDIGRGEKSKVVLAGGVNGH
jgi:hypothetical protein